jgi:hypothetical protein
VCACVYVCVCVCLCVCVCVCVPARAHSCEYAPTLPSLTSVWSLRVLTGRNNLVRCRSCKPLWEQAHRTVLRQHHRSSWMARCVRRLPLGAVKDVPSGGPAMHPRRPDCEVCASRAVKCVSHARLDSSAAEWRTHKKEENNGKIENMRQ